MTVQTTTNQINYTGDGATTVFPYTFLVDDKTWLKVYVNGTLQTVDTQYAVSGLGQESGGNVTFTTAPPSASSVIIARTNVPATQLIDFQVNEEFPPDDVEDGLDKLTVLIQQVTINVLRAVQIPSTDITGLNQTLPSAATRANMVIKFDAQGNANVAPYNSVIPEGTFQQPASGAVERTYQDKVAEIITTADFGATGDGVTDDTDAIQAAITYCKSTNKKLRFINTSVVSDTLDISGLSIEGDAGTLYHVQATSDQFNVFTTDGLTSIENLNVHGGWDGVTAGQTGDILVVNKTSPDYPYVIHIRDCRFLNAKKRGIFITRGGYSSIFNMRMNGCGLHGLEFYGVSITDATTTFSIGGMSVFSDCPNGYGVKITNCIALDFTDCISEGTKGIQIAGDNRNLKFCNYYQENTTGGKFLDWAGSSGIGLSVTNSFGGDTVIDYNANWFETNYYSNSLLITPAGAPQDRIRDVVGSELTTGTTGSYTATSVSLPPGTWLLIATVQSLNSVGGTITELASVLTTNIAAVGRNINTNGSFNFASDQRTYDPGTDANLRNNLSTTYFNTTSGNVTMYLRTYLNISAGNVSYKGAISAIRII